jgi:hypothetical protein
MGCKHPCSQVTARRELQATFRVRGEPFFITDRGLAVICELVDGEFSYASPVTVTLDGGASTDSLAESSTIESVRVDGGEMPGLIIPCERGSERADSLRRRLRPGVVLNTTQRG